jgi:protein AIR1/2
MAAESSTPSEIIDLTESTPTATPRPITSETEQSTVLEPSRKPRRKKKKKGKDSERQSADVESPSGRGQKRKSPDSPQDQVPVESRRRKKAADEEREQEQGEIEEETAPMEDDLFFVDVEPLAAAQDKPHVQPEPMYAPEPEQPVDNKLLLPAHVTVFGSTPVEIIAPTTSLEDDSIQFLDYDDEKVCTYPTRISALGVTFYEGVPPLLPNRNPESTDPNRMQEV